MDGDSIKVTWRGVTTDQSEEPLQGYQVRQSGPPETCALGTRYVFCLFWGESLCLLDSFRSMSGFQVEYWRSGETLYVSKKRDSGKKTHMRLSGLEQNVLYNLRVRGYSRGGDGLLSSPTIQFMLGPDCSVLEGESCVAV